MLEFLYCLQTDGEKMEMDKLIGQVNTKDRNKQILATSQFRKLLSIGILSCVTCLSFSFIEHNPPIQEVIDAQVFVAVLSFD
jgi:hypothetical protein